MSKLNENTAALQALLDAAENLPEAIELRTMTVVFSSNGEEIIEAEDGKAYKRITVRVNVDRAILQEKIVTPTSVTQEVVADDGYDGLGKVIVDGDSDLVPENIVAGKSIFGVHGTAESGGGSGGGSALETVTGTLSLLYMSPIGIDCEIAYTDSYGDWVSQTISGVQTATIQVLKNTAVYLKNNMGSSTIGTGATQICKGTGFICFVPISNGFIIEV